jgi:hypothetical protein
MTQPETKTIAIDVGPRTSDDFGPRTLDFLAGFSLGTGQIGSQSGDELRVQLAHARFREAQDTADLLESQSS